jgi:hypothetical protein
MHRQTEVRRLGQRLLQHGFPRLEMGLIVLVTGLAGLLASFAMLHAGMETMAVRYPLAVGVAFIALLLQLWAWLRLRHRWHEDLIDVAGELPSGGSDAAAPVSGHGGSFDGGGASGNFELFDNDLVGSSVEAAASAEEAAIPLLALVGIAAVALSMVLLAGSLVMSAPVLFAELLVDGAMSASLYRRLRNLTSQHWTQAVVRRTVVPFALTALFVALAGFAMEWAVPGAHTVSQFLHMPRD